MRGNNWRPAPMLRRFTKTTPNLSLPLLLALILSIALLNGCDTDKPTRLKTPSGRTLGHVVGWITLDGEPLAGAQVDFHNEFTKTCSAGTDENGYYELRFNRRLKGAPVGKQTVAIGLFGSNSEDPTDEPLPAAYNKKTLLTAIVKEGPNTISFHLTTPNAASELTELGTVSGMILLDGNPLPGARLVFQEGNRNNRAEAVSDRLGRYAMVFTETREGASVGNNQVTVSLTDTGGQETIPANYNSQTTLQRFVRSGNNHITFSLTSQTSPRQKPGTQPDTQPDKPASNGS
jgi:hypothetical protein